VGVWDHNLKRLVQTNPQAFLDWLFTGAVLLQECSVQLNRDIDMDMLYKALFEGEPVLVHLEFQRYNEKEMGRRLLEYNAYATGKFDLPVLSCVIYLKPEGPVVCSPLISKLSRGTVIWRFHFFNVELWKVPTEALRAVNHVSMYPLLALTRDGNRTEVVEEALRTIEHADLDRAQKDDLLTITLTLANLALRGPAHQEWLRKRFSMYQDLIRDTEIYQLIMQEGKLEGKLEGELEGLQRSIRVVIQRRFPTLIGMAEARTATLSSAEEAELLLTNLVDAYSLEEARGILAHPAPPAEPS
jgi:predicted transposase YdaD